MSRRCLPRPRADLTPPPPPGVPAGVGTHGWGRSRAVRRPEPCSWEVETAAFLAGPARYRLWTGRARLGPMVGPVDNGERLFS